MLLGVAVDTILDKLSGTTHKSWKICHKSNPMMLLDYRLKAESNSFS